MKATAAEYSLLNLLLEASVCVCERERERDIQTDSSVQYYAQRSLSHKYSDDSNS